MIVKIKLEGDKY